MSAVKTKVVLFTNPEVSGQIIYSFLSKKYDVLGVVFDGPSSKKKMVKKRIKKLGYYKVFLQLIFMKAMVPILDFLSKRRQKELLSEFDLNALANYNNILRPSSINDREVIDFTNKLNPDVIMVMGTRLIQKHIIDETNAPLINMHVGITPKYRGVHGGYWALVNKDLENCGVTVHLIDTGIDTGGVISQKTITPSKNDNYSTYPLLQSIKGLECVEDAFNQVNNNNIVTIDNGLESKLYYHPTITTYLYHRIINGVK